MSGIIKQLEDQIVESDTTETDVGEQRERNHRYYAMQPLGNEKRGRSHYIDPSVFSSVESKKAVYDETFLSSRQVVRFNGQNAQESEAKTAYAQTVLRKNHYEEIFRDGWHDAFVAKRMTVWVDWKRDREEVTLNFLGAPSPVVNQQLQQLGTVVGVNSEGLQSQPTVSPMGQQQFVHTGTLVVTVDQSYIDLQLVQPEYVMRDPERTYARDAMWNSQRMDITRLEMEDWGFAQSSIDKMTTDYRWGQSEEDYARKSFDRSTNSIRAGSRNGEQEEVTVYKTRTWMTIEPGDIEGYEPEGLAIYEIYWGSGQILRWDDDTPAVRVIDEMGVYEFTELKVSHAQNGLCTADVEAHQQKAASGLKRGVMDNMNITNNPRWEANPQGISDMRDLYDNAIGGVIETDNGAPPGQVKALDQPQLSPIVMGVMQMLDKDSEERSGISDLARGMNQGAITNQNADSMIDRLTTAGQRRVAMGCRSFANTFLIPLLQCIVRYGMKYDKGQTTMEAGGQQIVIAPSQWTDDDSMEVEVALTPDEAQAMSQKMLMMNQLLSDDEDMKPLYRVTQKHALYDTVWELMGVKDSTKFLAPPGSPQHQKAMQAAQQAQQQATAQAQEEQQFQRGVLDQQLTQGWAAINNKIMDTIEDNDLNRDQYELDVFKTTEELKLEEEQERGVAL